MFSSTQFTSGALAANGALYLVGAALCLVVALSMVRRLLVPIGPLVRAVAAVVAVVLCLVVALTMLAAAFLGNH